ncbi:MAG: HTH domain-containing protein [Euryarchaeota archaeon]|nr:HTH domain-containing protein [Euryarchaeota archaeon]
MKREEIFEFLKGKNKTLSAMEIAEEGNFNSNTVRKVLGELKREGAVNIIMEEGKTKYIKS